MSVSFYYCVRDLKPRKAGHFKLQQTRSPYRVEEKYTIARPAIFGYLREQEIQPIAHSKTVFVRFG